MDKWVGRAALVTGASAGIGAELAKVLAKKGMVVFGCARNVDKIKTLQQELRNDAGKVIPVQCDLRREEDIMKMFEFIEQSGGVDICINNAGVAFPATLMEGSTDQWRGMFEVNVLALCICTRESINSMKKRGIDDGHIIHISSTSGYRLTTKEEHFYACTKFAVRALTEGLRRELRQCGSNIRITCISPGCVTTEFGDRMYADSSSGYAGQSFQEMLPEDVVEAIIYAISTNSRAEVNDIIIRPIQQPT